MRWGIIFAAALTTTSATGAQAEGWCGYAAREKATIECGYSSAAECATATGKGGMCFVDPDYASNVTRATPAATTPALAPQFPAGRG
jgi:hypothetical protein